MHHYNHSKKNNNLIFQHYSILPIIDYISKRNKR